MKGLVRFLVAVIVLALLGYVGLLTYRTVQERRQQAASKQGPPILRVGVHRVETATLTHTISVTGELEPLASVEVVPKVTGRLERLRLPDGTLIDEGTAVPKGQCIAVLEHSALQAAVEAAKAAVKVAWASQEMAKVNHEDSLRERKRWENLYDGGSATAQQRDRAATACERCVAGLKLTEAQIAQAQAALRQAEVALNEATIEAPITGVVAAKYVDEGDMVGPARALLHIVQMDTVKVMGQVSERHLSALMPGKTTACLAVDAYPGERFDGVIHRVGTQVDSRTRTLEVEVRVANPNHRLKPGMFARLSIALERRENVTVVPDAALMRYASEVYAYVVNNAKVHRRILTLGLSEGTRHEVIKGLKPGDVVVVKGQHMLHEGDMVTIVAEGER